MSEVCVKIELDDQGQVTVGREPSEDYQGGDTQAGAQSGADEEQAEEAYMKPAKSIDAALATARQLLMQGQSEIQSGTDNQMQQGFQNQQPMGIKGPQSSYQ